MFFLSQRTSLLSARPEFLGTLLVCLLSASTVFGQSDTVDTEPNRGGLNIIQGNIYLPSGHRLDRRIRVRLNSVRTGESYTMTDSNGAFYFRRLSGGTYRISIDAGHEFEQAEEIVEILDEGGPRRARTGQTITVQVQLQLRGEGRVKPGTVDAEQAAIPKEARELYESALKEAETGNSKGAIEHLEGAIRFYPEFALAYNELGVQRLKTGDPGRALEAFRTAHRLAPHAFVLHLNLGIALVKNKKFQDAVPELQRVLEKDNSSTTAHLYLGRALIGLNKYDDAEKELLLAVAATNRNEAAQAYRYLGALYIQKGDDARAVDALQHFLALHPQDNDTEQVRRILEQLRSSVANKKP